jgi:general secretion pathway protein H
MRDTALWVSPAGYGFERYDGERWTPLGRPPFQDRQWPEETEVTVAQQDGERTRVVFDATGLNDPLDLTLARDGQQVGVAIRADGTIRVQG